MPTQTSSTSAYNPIVGQFRRESRASDSSSGGSSLPVTAVTRLSPVGRVLSLPSGIATKYALRCLPRAEKLERRRIQNRASQRASRMRQKDKEATPSSKVGAESARERQEEGVGESGDAGYNASKEDIPKHRCHLPYRDQREAEARAYRLERYASSTGSPPS